MAEIVSRAFVIGVLLFYAGLVMAFLLWSMGRRLRRPEKKGPGPAAPESPSARRILSPPFDAR